MYIYLAVLACAREQISLNISYFLVVNMMNLIRQAVTGLVNKVNKPDAIIYGENHGTRKCYEEQTTLIRQYRPEFVLFEGFKSDDAVDICPIPYFLTEAGVFIPELELRYNAIREVGAKVAGCDLASDYSFPERSKVTYEDYEKLIRKVQTRMNMKSEREKKMSERVVEFVSKRNTARPVMAIVGADHVRAGSGIYSILQEGNVKYETVSYKGPVEEPDLFSSFSEADLARANLIMLLGKMNPDTPLEEIVNQFKL